MHRTQKTRKKMRWRGGQIGREINNFVLCDCKLVTRAEPHSVPMVFGCDSIAFVVSFVLKVQWRKVTQVQM